MEQFLGTFSETYAPYPIVFQALFTLIVLVGVLEVRISPGMER